ncbi:MAG: DNA cytosine methyltransferase [Spirochaetaceae bacterium]|nr:DNA cytosine methyltransferase [Spirochaetaceae bacterium]
MSNGKNFSGVDLFSGAGGLSLGAEWAGIDVQYAVELDKSASLTYKKNHSSSLVLNEDIARLDKNSFPNLDNLFILFGGPPCQGFSTSNQKTRNNSNPKNRLYLEFLRLVHELKPVWVVIENVQGIYNFDNGKIVRKIVDDLNSCGYRSKKTILNSVDFGVPQKRKRFILVANRHNIDFEFPQGNPSFVSVGDAISDLPELQNGDMKEECNYIDCKLSNYMKLMRGKSNMARQNYVSKNSELVIKRYAYIGQGENWKSIPKELMTNYKDMARCHSGIYKRLNNNEPSVVISNYRKNMLIHPTQDRGLSVREAARLQSFPDDYIFEGSISEIQQQIGNAVPPLLSKVIFSRILEYE